MPNPNNQNNQNEAQLSEVKKTLEIYENQMNGMHFQNEGLEELHRNFKVALHDLSRETDRYYTSDAQGNYPVMNAQAFTQFEALYRNAYRAASALETGLRAANPAQLSKDDAIGKQIYDGMIDMVRNVLGQDLQHLHSVQRRGNETLPALIEQSRTHVYNVDGQNLEQTGGALSSRLAITIPGENDGDVIRGFFTESITTDKQTELEELIRTTVEKYPDLEDVLDNTVYLNPFAEDITLDMAENPLLDGRGGGVFVDWLEETLPNEACRKKLAEDGELLSAYTSYRKQREMLEAKYDKMYDVCMLGKNDKVDQRNCAMSTIADLMGMSNLLAHAEPVQIQYTENGETKTLSGSFMRFAEGQDLNGQQLGQGLLNVNAPVDMDVASFKRQMSDIQVLDYICGNVDRHGRNLFYQVDQSDPAHPRLTGIQGIDNDASFSLQVGPDYYGKIIAPDNMVMIRSQTAAMVESLDKDVLKTMLRNYNLSAEQIDAVWTRTQNLQQAIRDGKEYFKDKPANEVNETHLHVMDDDTFEQVSIRRLGNFEKNNYFKTVKDVTNSAVQLYADQEKAKTKQQTFDSVTAFNKAAGQIKSLQKDLEAANSVFRRRPEYAELLQSVKAVNDLEKLNMMKISKESIEARLPVIRSAVEAANAYLAHKQADYNKEMTEAREKYNTEGLSERAKKKAISNMNKAINEIQDKYFGKKSADAKRIRAAEAMQQALNQYVVAGENALAGFAETKRVKDFGRAEWAEEFRSRLAQNQAQALQQPAQEIEQPGRENRKAGRKLSLMELQEKLGAQDANKGRKTVFENQAQQKEKEKDKEKEIQPKVLQRSNTSLG